MKIDQSQPVLAKNKIRASRNKTMTITPDEGAELIKETVTLAKKASTEDFAGKIIYQDIFSCTDFLPSAFIDLLIVDPPYNLNKQFSETKFSKTTSEKYEQWLESWLHKILHCLKPESSIYVCCDWQSSHSVQTVLQKYFIVRNRITWEREKGRGAAANWKNCAEDIWFCTMSNNYYFDVESVKINKRVIAPYRDQSGAPKDWQETDAGNFRLTYPSNLWTDISIPFWSMAENTDHPTQKPEKLIAKLILASSKQNDFVFDPFVGSGTTCVTAKKLGRRFSGVEIEALYCQLAMKRLRQAENDQEIQGYHDGCFWERNSMQEQKKSKKRTINSEIPVLFHE
ncbi:DNA-methyltransferase [Candidatus Magnetaquicoccus inordinatus]|uniref:DNA-methyltransferase n=1 Tax=Candidatus Magnetaquicoccus inordinatus TaxID=2496818 RepID=UPI00102C0714|nr:site-specific DNA-methyltransferase [Candidatus Magnetaquicoccus inordinatus]